MISAANDVATSEQLDLFPGHDRRDFTFYLGTHHAQWLEDERFDDVPLFVSRRTLTRRRKLPRARGRWSLDGGGFTELQLFGQWTVAPAEYVADVRRFRDEIGGLDWAAPQDWMCEPVMLARTGLSVSEHQRRTVENFVELRAIAPDLPIIPVLQGWHPVDYWRCERMYVDAGVNLAAEPVVGVGTVCRRQGMQVARTIMTTLRSSGLRLHGFGFKSQGIETCIDDIVSADSLAWSYQARRREPLPGHDRPGPGRRVGHINCANCAEYALEWRSRLLDRIHAAPLQEVA